MDHDCDSSDGSILPPGNDKLFSVKLVASVLVNIKIWKWKGKKFKLKNFFSWSMFAVFLSFLVPVILSSKCWSIYRKFTKQSSLTVYWSKFGLILIDFDRIFVQIPSVECA